MICLSYGNADTESIYNIPGMSDKCSSGSIILPCVVFSTHFFWFSNVKVIALFQENVRRMSNDCCNNIGGEEFSERIDVVNERFG